MHEHDFYLVLEHVYNYPESFSIPKNSLKEYSKQELEYINKLQEKCLNDGLKDINYFSDDKTGHYFLGYYYNINELKKRGIKKLPVVWSDETPKKPENLGENKGSHPAPASMVFVPATAGITAASYAIRKLMEK